MIKPEQFLTTSLKAHPYGEDITRVLAAAIQAVDPYQAISRHMRLMDEDLHLGGRTYALRRYRRIFLVGAGKAGLPMTQAVVDVLGSRIVDGVVIVKEGYGGPDKVGTVKIREAGHPVPDQRGIAATREILEILSHTEPDDLVIAVISGGGSALLTDPIPGVSLEELQTLTGMLLACGAEIGEINQIRRRLDQVKGGGLVRAADPARVAALILSDVVGDPLEYIASGPTVLSARNWQETRAIVEKYQLGEQIPPHIRTALNSPPLPPFSLQPPNNILVANNLTAANAAIQTAESLGYRAGLLTNTLSGEARLVGQEYGEMLKMLAEEETQRPVMWVAGGETTVTITGEGRGGRNQELALAAVPALSGSRNEILVSLATDGGDGNTGAAGAVVTGESMQRASALGLDPAEYLANNDSHTFFRHLGDCLMPGPTRTNVNDLLFLFSF